MGFQVLHESLENKDRLGRNADHVIGLRDQRSALGADTGAIVVQFQQFSLLRVAGLAEDRRFQRRVMELWVVLLQDVLHVLRDLVDPEREEQGLGLEIAGLQDEQYPTCQAVTAIGHRAFLRREGGIVDAPVVRKPGAAVEIFDLGVLENRHAVFVSSGHGESLCGKSIPAPAASVIRDPAGAFPSRLQGRSMVNN